MFASCTCGNRVEVTEAQAGSWTKCSCGRDMAVPSLRELRTAPPPSSSDIREELPARVAPPTNQPEADTEQDSDQAIGALFTYAAKRMINDVPPDTIKRELMNQGASEELAGIVVGRLQNARNEGLRQAGQKNMLFGALWCIGGILVTAFTYSAASSGGGGGRYVIAWGAIIFGAIQFFRGLSQSSES